MSKGSRHLAKPQRKLSSMLAWRLPAILIGMAAALGVLVAAAATVEKVAATTAPESAKIPATVRVCGDDSGWQPYTFVKALPDGSNVITGYSVEYIRTVLQRAGHQMHIELLPWKRCIALARSGHYDIALDVVNSPERLAQFLLPRSHYRVTAAYLYSTARAKPILQTPADFAHYRICHQAGYIYGSVIPAEVRSLVNAEAKSLAAAMKMLEQGRCDVLLNSFEFIDSHVASGHLPALDAGRIAVAKLMLPDPGRARPACRRQFRGAAPASVDQIA